MCQCHSVHNKCHADWPGIEDEPQADRDTSGLWESEDGGVKQNGGTSEERSAIWAPVTSRSEHGIRFATAIGGIFTYNVATMSHRLAPFIHNVRYKNPETILP